MTGIETQQYKAYVYANTLNTGNIENVLKGSGVKYSRYSLAGSQTLYYYEVWVNDSQFNQLSNGVSGYGLISRDLLPILNPAISQEIVSFSKFNSLTGTIPDVFVILPTGQNKRAWIMPTYKATTAGVAGTVSLSFGGGAFYDVVPANSQSTVSSPFTTYCNRQPAQTLSNITTSSCIIATEIINRCSGLPNASLTATTNGAFTANGTFANGVDSNTEVSTGNWTISRNAIDAYMSLVIDMGASYRGYAGVFNAIFSPAGGNTNFVQITLDISVDGITWTNIFSTAGGAGNQTISNISAVINTARYIRLYGYQQDTNIAALAPSMSFNEICFWDVDS